MSKSDLIKQLEQSSYQINFNEIKFDILNQVLFLVSPNLVLLDVATACALDDKESVKTWLEKGLIKRPEDKELELWKKENTIFDCSIVKPFIFLQKASLN